VRGQDRYGYFASDPIPARDLDPEILAFVDSPLGGVPWREREDETTDR